MVTMTTHGGMCCGARHLHGFTSTENNNPDLIDAALAQVPVGRQAEVILNGSQVQSYPRILQRLADLGFVLSGHWINNNHNSHNYSFTRCDRRLPLDLPQWNAVGGMVISSTMGGDLPARPAVNPVAAGSHLRLLPNGLLNPAFNHLPNEGRSFPDWRNPQAIQERFTVYYMGDTAGNLIQGRKYYVRAVHNMGDRPWWVSLSDTGTGPVVARTALKKVRRTDYAVPRYELLLKQAYRRIRGLSAVANTPLPPAPPRPAPARHPTL